MGQDLISSAQNIQGFPKKLEFLFQPQRYKVSFGGRGGAKCLAVGTPIIMFDGTLRNIEDVQVGELVMGPDSEPRQVLSTCSGEEQLYLVRQSSGMPYRTNGAHLLSLKKDETSKRDGRYPDQPGIVNIPVIDYMEKSARWKAHFHGYRAGLIEFDYTEAPPIDPYFLGIWLGDGTSRELRITNMDSEVIEYCKNYAAEFGLGFSLSRKPGQLAYDVGFPPIKIRKNALWQLFLQMNLAKDKHIPLEYMRGTEKVRLEILAGLIDSDGTKHHNGYVFTNTNKELAFNVKRVADYLGFRTNIRQIKTQCLGKIGTAFRVSINGDTWRIPCKVARKIIRVEEIHKNKDFLRSEMIVEKDKIGKFAGIEIDGDHLFLLADGTVTHNSWGYARALLIQGTQRPIRVLCARELQNSIKDSVHRLLEDQIAVLGLSSFYEVQQSTIIGKNGTEFSFEGIKHNVSKIKSYEGVDICWVEEAHLVSKRSWDTLIPTIRKEGSEIWVSFNPELSTDETYQRFVKPGTSGVTPVKLTWRDNPWFPKTLDDERLRLKARDPDAYLNVWEGECLLNLDGAIYAKELRKATEEGRICRVPYDATVPVDTIWDLGRADSTAIWFYQKVGFEHHFIDYYENRLEGLQHYLKYCQGLEYVYNTFWLPHDAQAKELGTKLTVEEQIRKSGRRVRIVKRHRISDGIAAARTIFGNSWFDEEKCADGVNALRHYRYEVETGTQTLSKEPLHDWASHGADAFRYASMTTQASREKTKEKIKRIRESIIGNSLGWMNS